ncbi:hypothetical protein KC320_g259 [Hortaea werneckii]|nr:hypothetical protein KC320_g259 [Hortaea werneckii]
MAAMSASSVEKSNGSSPPASFPESLAAACFSSLAAFPPFLTAVLSVAELLAVLNCHWIERYLGACDLISFYYYWTTFTLNGAHSDEGSTDDRDVLTQQPKAFKIRTGQMLKSLISSNCPESPRNTKACPVEGCLKSPIVLQNAHIAALTCILPISGKRKVTFWHPPFDGGCSSKFERERIAPAACLPKSAAIPVASAAEISIASTIPCARARFASASEMLLDDPSLLLPERTQSSISSRKCLVPGWQDTEAPDLECGTRSLPGGRRSFAGECSVPSGMDHIMDIIRSTAQIDSQSSALCHRSRSIVTVTVPDRLDSIASGAPGRPLSSAKATIRRMTMYIFLILARPSCLGLDRHQRRATSMPANDSTSASSAMTSRSTISEMRLTKSLLCCNGYGQEGLLLPESVEASHRLASDAILIMSSREDEGLSFSLL